MNDINKLAVGQRLCLAVGAATGLQRIRGVQINGRHDDETTVTVEFIPTEEQMQAIGDALAAEGIVPSA